MQEWVSNQQLAGQSVVVRGHWRTEFMPLVKAFAENFSQGETGASVALFQRGEIVAHLWAGERSNKISGISSEAWNDKTLVNIFSVGKALTAICVLQLIEVGKLSLDTPIAHYWPEFGVAGKEQITLRQVMCHRSGVSAFHPLIKDEDIFDWARATDWLAQETPWWEPNSAQGYSAFLYGWILGELVKRVSGAQSFGEYFHVNVAQPLGVDCFFGVPESDLNRIADVAPIKKPLTAFVQQNEMENDADTFALVKLMRTNPRGVTNRAFCNPVSLMVSSNTKDWRQAQIPAANAHANANALARIFGALACGGENILRAETLPLCSNEQSFEADKVLGLGLRFGCGMMLSQANRPDCRYGRGARAFGHPGAGGCVGFADPDFELGFGYVTQSMGQSLLIDERAVRLIDAAYSVLV